MSDGRVFSYVIAAALPEEARASYDKIQGEIVERWYSVTGERIHDGWLAVTAALIWCTHVLVKHDDRLDALDRATELPSEGGAKP